MIDKHKLFPPNELYTFELDSPVISRIECDITRTELANRYVKKTTRRHQNNKKIVRLESDRERAIYNHNKFELFGAVSGELDKRMSQLLDKQFDNFASVSGVSFEIDR